ncbi:MAG: hypothetical protein R2863_04780 [Candidatus Kapaibacterium sp.]|nr:hypothetical protein [Ignavibacteriota bacterium]
MKYIIFILLIYGNAISQIPSVSKNLYTPVKIEIDSVNSTIIFDRINAIHRYGYYLKQLETEENKFLQIADYNDLEDSIYEVDNIEKNRLYEFNYINQSSMRYNTYEGFPYSQAKSNTFFACGQELESYVAKRTVLLLVDSTVYYPLESEIMRLRDDLVSEGWGVRMIKVDRTDSSFIMKFLPGTYFYTDKFIKSNPDLNIESILIIGRVPKWYSGKYAPDYQPKHFGCWPTDGFFGMRANFFQDYIFNTEPNNSSKWDRNNHSPNDLRYQYDTYLHRVEQMIGRIDMSDLPSFDESEIELLRKYLNKNHKYRTGQLPFRRRGLIDDKLADAHLREAPASSGWRNFNSMFGPDSISEGDYFSTLAIESYMASYACGKGQPFDSLDGVGSSKDFATKQVNTIFTMLYGDYIGDWDSPDNFLRASLASEPSILTAAWVGHPHWFMHHMSIGYPIGYSTRLTQNNDIYVPLEHFQTDTTSKPYDPYKNGVHVGLLGDPTLTMYPLDLENSVSNLKAEKVNDYTVRLT